MSHSDTVSVNLKSIFDLDTPPAHPGKIEIPHTKKHRTILFGFVRAVPLGSRYLSREIISTLFLRYTRYQ